MKYFLAIALLALTACSNADEDPGQCAVRGTPVLWAMSFCMALNETDDELHPGVISCFNAQRISPPWPDAQGECAINHSYKAALCGLLIGWQSFKGGILECIESPETDPWPVRQGGI